MTAPTYEELQAENERLLTANDTLARHVIATSARLEEGKRELLAIGWDKGYTAGHSRAMRKMSDEPNVEPGVNPYRQPVGFGADQ